MDSANSNKRKLDTPLKGTPSKKARTQLSLEVKSSVLKAYENCSNKSELARRFKIKRKASCQSALNKLTNVYKGLKTDSKNRLLYLTSSAKNLNKNLIFVL